MSLIRQNCPSCNRLLELPETAAGKTAKCPACQTQFKVPDGVEKTTESSPFSKPIGGSLGGSGFGGSALETPPAPNPYQPSVTTAPTIAQVGELRISQRSVEEIFGVTTAIFKERWDSLVGAFLIVFCISIAMFVVTSIIGAVAQGNGGQNVGALVQSLMSVVTTPVSLYLYLGLVRNALAVARNQPSPLNQLISPMQYFLRFLGGGLLVGFVFVAVMAVIGGIIAAIAVVGGGEAFALGAIFLAVIIFFPLAMASWWLLWSWPFVVADGRGTVTSSFRIAYAISMSNKMTSLLLLVIAMTLSVAGILACYIGQIVTTPLLTLMMGVGYLMMTSQPLSDSRMTMHSQFAPRPAEPTF